MYYDFTVPIPVVKEKMETSVTRCQMLLEPLRFTCQLHGVDVPDYQLILNS